MIQSMEGNIWESHVWQGFVSNIFKELDAEAKTNKYKIDNESERQKKLIANSFWKCFVVDDPVNAN